MDLSKDISSKKSLIVGLILITASFVGMKYAEKSDIALLFFIVSLPLGLFLVGMALAKIFVEPMEQPLIDYASVLVKNRIVKIPSNLRRYTNFAAFFFILFFILVNLMIRQDRGLGEVIFLLTICAFSFVYILFLKNTQYFLYPDKILIKRAEFWKQEILFKDIASVTIEDGGARSTLSRSGNNSVIANGIASAVLMFARKEYASTISITNKNRRKYFLGNIVHPEQFVDELKKLISNS